MQPIAAHETGFTLIEVLVALSIVAIALLAGLQATAALTINAMRQSDIFLAQVCAENELVRIRLRQQMPDVGEKTSLCQQAGQPLQVTLLVQRTPNPKFRRVDAQISRDGATVLRLSTVVNQD